MKTLAYSITGLILATGAAQAQPADETLGAVAHGAAHVEAAVPADPARVAEAAAPADPAAASADAAAAADGAAAVTATPAEPAIPAQASASAPTAPAIVAADLTEAEIESFAQATVKLQAIETDIALAPEQKQTAMVAAVTEVGLDAAKYNAIGRAAQADTTLRARVQSAMSKYTAPARAEG